MCQSNQTTFTGVARDKIVSARDQRIWTGLRGTTAHGWEGDADSPGETLQRNKGDTGVFQWNAGKQLAVKRPRPHGTDSESHNNWFDILDTIHGTGCSLATLEELGCGGSADDEIVIRALVARWSTLRGISAHIWLAGGPRWSEDGKDLRGSGGASAGLAIIAMGAWARRGRAARRWANGRGLWVEFHEGNQLLCLGCVYGHASGSAAENDQWRLDVTTERAEAAARGCTTLVSGDFNCRRSAADAESGRHGDSRADAWFVGEDFTDVWQARHNNSPGFTWQPDDERKSHTRTRIDYMCLDSDMALAGIHGAWLAPWGESFVLKSDHRPLLAMLDTEQWLGSVKPPPPTANATTADAAFPPRHMFISSDTEAAEAEADIAAGRLPRKIPRSRFSEACELPEVAEAIAAVRFTLAAQRQSGTLLTLDNGKGQLAVWNAITAVGRSISEALKGTTRKVTLVADGVARKPGHSAEATRLKGLRRWLRKLRHHGSDIFLEGGGASHGRFTEVPDELWELWAETTALEHRQGGTNTDDRNRLSQAWQLAVETARMRDADDRDGLGSQCTLPKHAEAYTRTDWLVALLRIRIGAARADIRQSHRAARSTSEWSRRLAVATSSLEGHTGGVYEAINPRTRPIRVDGANMPDASGTMRWYTDNATLRQSAADHCAETVRITEDKERRGTKLSPADRASGKLDEQFLPPDRASARAVLNERMPLIDAAELVHTWTEQKLLTAVTNCDDSAPGPSGLCYWMIEAMPETLRASIAECMNFFQDTCIFPEEMRHGYVYPIPKSGPGGSTFAGARQIVLLEILMKLISGGIAENAMRIWEERGYLHWAQHGFRKGHNAGDVVAAVAAIQSLYRAKGKTLYTVAADVTKAFQSVGIAAVEAALRRLGLPEAVIELWMQTDRGSWTAPSADGGRWSATYSTCQVITAAGLSPSFEAESGVRQGERASATKYLAWMEMLWAFLDSEHVQGAPIDLEDPESRRIAFLGFADDIWCASDDFDELQRMVALIDEFLMLFHVELNPGKSMYAVISPRPGDTRQVVLEREIDGETHFVALQRVAQDQGYRYLGVMLQPDGGWQAMTAVVMGKIRNWACQVARSGLPLDQATMVMRSVVGGLLNYVLRAAPLSAQCMERIDKLVAAALFRCAGLAKGRRTAWAFTTRQDGGMGACSAVILRRAVVLETVLTWLNGSDPQ